MSWADWLKKKRMREIINQKLLGVAIHRLQEPTETGKQSSLRSCWKFRRSPRPAERSKQIVHFSWEFNEYLSYQLDGTLLIKPMIIEIAHVIMIFPHFYMLLTLFVKHILMWDRRSCSWKLLLPNWLLPSCPCIHYQFFSCGHPREGGNCHNIKFKCTTYINFNQELREPNITTSRVSPVNAPIEHRKLVKPARILPSAQKWVQV